MTDLSRSSRTILRWYVALVLAGLLFAFSGGPLGGIFVLPLLLPWPALLIYVDYATGRTLLTMPWVGGVGMVLSGAANAYLLFLLLRFRDRRKASAAEHRS